MKIPSRVYPLLLLLLGGLAYVSSFSAGFVFDDAGVQNDQRIRHILPRGTQEWFRDRPFVDLTFALNYAWGKLNPSDYHATNVVIHLLAGLLLYGIIRRTLALPGIAGRFGSRADTIAFWASAVWVAHPLNTAAVTYVCQRYETMMGMFYLLSLYALIRGACSSPLRWSLVAVAACALGTASKEVMFTAPFVLLIYDRVFLSSSFRELAVKRLFLYISLLAVCVIVFLLPLALGMNASSAHGKFDGRFTWFYYGLTQCSVILHYLRLSFWPHPLCLDYFWLLVAHPVDVLPEVAVVGALVLTTILMLRYKPRLGFLGVWFFVILSPSSSIVFRPDCAFEHRMYLSLIAVVTGSAVALAELLYRLYGRHLHPARGEYAVYTIFMAAATLALAVTTYHRNLDYASNETIWLDTVTKRPGNIRACVNLSGYYLSTGKPDKAQEYCIQALKHLPDFSRMSVEELKSRRSAPDIDRLYREVSFYSRIHNNMGLALEQDGRPDDAVAHFKEAMRLVPNNVEPQVNLASMMFSSGQTSEAIAMLRHAVDLEPRNVAGRECLGNALYFTGDAAGAAGSYGEILKVDPDNVAMRCKLAWILATSSDAAVRDGTRALRLATEAAGAVDYGNARALEVLAAAYAENGRFDEAVQMARKAVGIAGPDEKTVIETRLEVYSKGMPYREPLLNLPPGGKGKTDISDGI